MNTIKSFGLVACVLILALLIITSPGASVAGAGSMSREKEQEEALHAFVHGKVVPAGQRDLQAETFLSPEFPVLSATAPEALTGNIAFQSDRSRAIFDIYSIPADGGTSAHPLMSSSGNDVTPVWSPGGNELALASNRDGNYEIYLYTGDGEAINLTQTPAEDAHPSWSPDGEEILFVSNREGGFFQPYRMNRDGTNVRRVTVVSGNNVGQPRYSPDGTRIAYMRASILEPTCLWNWDVWVMNADGTNQQPVSEGITGDLYPTWTPDGTEIVYTDCRSLGFGDLYAVNPDTGRERQINSWFFSDEWNANFSPDGEHFAFTSNSGGDEEIYVAPWAGGDAFNLTRNSAMDRNGTWTLTEVLAPLPVILVPGYYASWCKRGTQEECGWFPVLAESVYKQLELALSPHVDYSVCHYNWMMSNKDSAQQLAKCVREARERTGAEKVNLIAHSNGNMVSRYYIQSSEDPKVNILIQIAPPNKGVVKAYGPWAGGDISAEEPHFQAIILLAIMAFDREEDLFCDTFPLELTQRCIYSTIRNHLPSTGELLPVEIPYLYHLDKEEWLTPDEDGMPFTYNDFLIALNEEINALYEKVARVVIFAGQNQHTLEYIDVEAPSLLDVPLWADGKAKQYRELENNGDGTILFERARLPQCQRPACVLDERRNFQRNHLGIVSEAISDILRELGLHELTTVETYQAVAPRAHVLYFLGRSTGTLLVTDPFGRRFGHLADGSFISEIPGAEYFSVEEGVQIIVVPNPLSGDYQTQLSAEGFESEENYLIAVVWDLNAEIELLHAGSLAPDGTVEYVAEHRVFNTYLPTIGR